MSTDIKSNMDIKETAVSKKADSTTEEGVETTQEKRPTPDAYQQMAIDSKLNTVVSAGAGSGKTAVLSLRFLDFVLNRGCEVKEILTLTFTKKATTEMSSRIYQRLKESAPDRAADFHTANIKTLDSYCSQVAKTGAHLYGITPDFTQDEESLKAKLNSMALPFVLKHKEHPAIISIAQTTPLSTIAEEVFVNPFVSKLTVTQPVDFFRCFSEQIEYVSEKWNETVTQFDSQLNDLDTEILEYSGNRSTPTFQAFLDNRDTFGSTQAPDMTPEIINNFDSHIRSKIQDFVDKADLLTSKLPSGKGEALDALKAPVYAMRETLRTFKSYANFMSGTITVKGLLPLLEEFQNQVNVFKRSSGILSFSDIASLAVTLLKEHPEIRLVEKQKFKQIMIDEFQDDNSLQRDLLFMLAEKIDRMEPGVPSVDQLEKDKLFFVGDEKQSIYRFRNADVTVFKALQNDFSDGCLNMKTNYRSTPALIAGFNTIFGGYNYPPDNEPNENPSVFFKASQAETTNIPEYEATYDQVDLSDEAKKLVDRKENWDKIYAPQITVALYDKKANDIFIEDHNQNKPDSNIQFLDEEEAEAEWVACEIERLLAMTDEDGKIKYKPQDIAILFRSYTLQPLYERALLRHGINYNTETITTLFADGPVNDFYNLLKLCIYPKDRLCYTKLLCSPFINLSTEQAAAVLLQQRSDEFKQPFTEDVSAILAPDAQQRFLKGKELYEEILQDSTLVPLTKIITKLWYTSGYRFETLWNEKVSMYQDLYDRLFEIARQCDILNTGLNGFIDTLRVYTEEGKKLEGVDVPIERTPGVTITSIFKSKGLEWPVVFTCATHKQGKRENNSSPIYISTKWGLTINTPACDMFSGKGINNCFYEEVHAQNQSEKKAELRRVTYVALTRAVERLYITNGKYIYDSNALNKFIPGGEDKAETIYDLLAPVMNIYNPYVPDDSEEESTKDSGSTSSENRPDFSASKDGPELFFDPDKDTGPFNFVQIKPTPRTAASGSARRSNTQAAKQELLEAIQKQGTYQDAECISTEEVPQKYVRPSMLHKKDDETGVTEGNDSLVINKDAPYPEITQIVIDSIPKNQPHAKPRFNFNHFGTIAHAFMEAAATGETPRISNRDIVGLDNSKSKLKTIEEVCLKMQKNFEASQLGKEAFSSKWKKAEYSFRCRIGSNIIKGIIDLVYQNEDGTYTIVDYKSNQEEHPDMYYNQLACYRFALAQMKSIPVEDIKCYLYYLRFDHPHSVTDECAKIDVEQIAATLQEQLENLTEE